MRYIDNGGQVIKIGDARTEPVLKFSGCGSSERLDPGKDMTQSVDVDFPAGVLESKKLTEIRLDLKYLLSSYKQQTVSLTASIRGWQEPLCADREMAADDIGDSTANLKKQRRGCQASTFTAVLARNAGHCAA